MSSFPAASKRLSPEFSVLRGISSCSQGKAAERTSKKRCVVAEHAASYPLGRWPAVQRRDEAIRSSQRIASCVAVTSRARLQKAPGGDVSDGRVGGDAAPRWRRLATRCCLAPTPRAEITTVRKSSPFISLQRQLHTCTFQTNGFTTLVVESTFREPSFDSLRFPATPVSILQRSGTN